MESTSIYPLLRAVDAVDADSFKMLVVQYFEGVTIENVGNGAGVVGGTDNSWDEEGCPQQEWCPVRYHGRGKVATDCHRVARR